MKPPGSPPHQLGPMHVRHFAAFVFLAGMSIGAAIVMFRFQGMRSQAALSLILLACFWLVYVIGRVKRGGLRL